MRWRALVDVWAYSLAFWALFMLAGSGSNYFLDSPTWLKWAIDVVPVVVLALLGGGLVHRIDRTRAWPARLTVAGLFSIPYLAYDAAFLVGYLGAGAEYWREWWHLTAFSLMPWFAMPFWGLRPQGPN